MADQPNIRGLSLRMQRLGQRDVYRRAAIGHADAADNMVGPVRTAA